MSREEMSFGMALGRRLAIWLGSMLVTATFLLIYWHIPLGPLFVGGGVTLVATLLQTTLSHRRSRSENT